MAVGLVFVAGTIMLPMAFEEHNAYAKNQGGNSQGSVTQGGNSQGFNQH